MLYIPPPIDTYSFSILALERPRLGRILGLHLSWRGGGITDAQTTREGKTVEETAERSSKQLGRYVLMRLFRDAPMYWTCNYY